MTEDTTAETDSAVSLKRGRPAETPMVRAAKLLSAIENADPEERHQWDMAVVRCIDVHPNDFYLGLRRLVRGQ